MKRFPMTLTEFSSKTAELSQVIEDGQSILVAAKSEHQPNMKVHQNPVENSDTCCRINSIQYWGGLRKEKGAHHPYTVLME